MKVHKRQSTSEDHVDSFKGKAIEEVLAEIKKSSAADDVASAGFQSFEQLPDGEISPEQDAKDDEEEEDGKTLSVGTEKHEEGRSPKWHMTYGYHMVRGKMEHGMEDYVVAKKRNIGGKELGLYAIFDGHAGRDVAEYLQQNLFNNILSQPDFWEHPEEAVKRAYKETDEEILDKVAESRGGSTAVTAILINRERLIVANVGDSRGILCKKRDIEQITVDHEPEREKELVEERGGCVFQRPGNIPRVDGVLAMTRAFGDGRLKEHISAKPDVKIEMLGADAKFIVLASDGLWKVMSNEEACDCIEELDDAQAAAEQLVKEALQRKSADDISCVVVMFHD
ncbi:probable protein phosphatase 2C 39 isoform X2 [Beta vulgaris subsp. vulgaris]|uniref:probable protein phosphatase 2C 39 isoform X2 n=1 Tax=Beta vulgaris subsp. vulgaris TaxID=3555 RepID=UPI0020372ACF|nr:probable protein phosphatase 2C 39 isoform X2 [Beta vulgaris subsp. vulgaris]